jgi:hypothetical protein
MNSIFYKIYQKLIYNKIVDLIYKIKINDLQPKPKSGFVFHKSDTKKNQIKNIENFKKYLLKYDFIVNDKIKECEINKIIKFILNYNHLFKLNSNEIFDLIQKGYLNTTIDYNKDPIFLNFKPAIFIDVLCNNKNLFLSKEQLKFFYKQLIEKQKICTFIHIISDREKYKKEMNFLLYDCGIELTKELEKEIFNYNYHHYNEIIKIIKQRNLFFELESNLNKRVVNNKKLKI